MNGRRNDREIWYDFLHAEGELSGCRALGRGALLHGPRRRRSAARCAAAGGAGAAAERAAARLWGAAVGLSSAVRLPAAVWLQRSARVDRAPARGAGAVRAQEL